MAVVRGYDYQRIIEINLFYCGADGIRKFDCILKCSVCIAEMMRLIDPAALNHKEKTFWVLRENIDGLCSHVGKRRFVLPDLFTIIFKIQMVRIEKTEQMFCLFGIDRSKLCFIPYICGILSLVDPLFCQIAS